MIKTTRNNLKITQKELAKKIGVKQAYISEIENHKRVPSIEILFILSEELNICPMKLFIFFAENKGKMLKFHCCQNYTSCLIR